jgi:sugar lactone lactonase YvrE
MRVGRREKATKGKKAQNKSKMEVETVLHDEGGLFDVNAICINKAGDVVFTNGASVCQISAGEVTMLAGVCGQRGHTDGVGENARFSSELYGLAAGGPDGSIIVSDSANNCIRKIAPDGTTSTLAGAAGVGGFSNGQGAAAKFSFPTGVAVDGEGSTYVADYNTNHIRKITPGGAVTTFAGSGASGSTDGPGANASFNCPWGLAIDGDGNLIVADINNHLIRKITPDGIVTTVAGVRGGAGFADGPALNSKFNDPTGVALDGDGNIFVADDGNCRVRKITPDGVVSTVAGSGEEDHADGRGTSAKFTDPGTITIDGNGDLFVGDLKHIRRIAAGATPPALFHTVPACTHLANLATLLDDTTFADVEFQVGDETTTAHRNVLATRCEYFHTLFKSNFADSKLGDNGKVLCRVEDTTMPALKFLLRHLYTGSMDHPPDEDAVEVIRLADRYGVERLFKHCSDTRRITHANAVPWLIQSDQHNLTTLRASAKRHVVQNFRTIRKDKRQKFDLLFDHPKLVKEVMLDIE